MNDKRKEVLAIIPARGGSKGVPRKNILEINNLPLIAYTILEAKKSKYITKVIVSTDDDEIAKISKGYGAEVPFIRPEELAGDNARTIDAVKHAISSLKTMENYESDIICVLQCTSPLRKVNDIDNALHKLMETESDGVVSVCECENNPYWCNVLVDDKLEYFIEEGRQITRRQDLPKVFFPNGAIYAVKTKTFVEEETLEPKNVTGYVMDRKVSIDIDDYIDFKIAEIIMGEGDNI